MAISLAGERPPADHGTVEASSAALISART
jgi:hypothetical protein